MADTARAETPEQEAVKAVTGLSDVAVGRLLAVSRPFAHEAGTALFREGDASDGLYIILSGQASVRTRMPGDDELSVTTLGPGELLGEMGLLDGARRSATATADTAITGLFISRPRFSALAFDPSPGSLDVIDRVRTQIASRLRRTYGAIAETQAFDPASLRHAAEGLAPQPLGDGDASALLASLIRFAKLTAADREALSTTASVMTAERGATLAQPGLRTDTLWLVLRGAIRVGVPRPGGHEQPRRICRYGFHARRSSPSGRHVGLRNLHPARFRPCDL